MARINPAGQSWSSWFAPRFKSTGLTGPEFADRIIQAGGKASKQAVSQWVNGENTAEPNTVVVIAGLLMEDPAAALRAAGYGIVADAMGGELHLAGAEPAPVDPGILLIVARKGLTLDEQAEQIKRYKQRLALIRADLKEHLDAILAPRDESDSA